MPNYKNSSSSGFLHLLTLFIVSAAILGGVLAYRYTLDSGSFTDDAATLQSSTVSTNEYAIPAQSDWTDHGTIFTSGAYGQWDYYLWGAFGGSVMKKDGTYYLYYQGAKDYDDTEETVTWRAIGVATSTDGINFTKYTGNPVLTWFPTNNIEEGATSTAPAFGDNGEIVMYYGANRAVTSSLVNADGRVATSTNGLNFADQGIALDHNNRIFWGYGDELFPIIAIHDGGQWIVYYLPNGAGQTRKLGVAWGTSFNNLTSSAPATSSGVIVPAWGMGGSAKIGPDTYAIFHNNETLSKTYARTMSLSAPNILSEPVQTYQFPGVIQATVFLDTEVNKWFMYYRTESTYGVRTAPAVILNPTTPPAPPEPEPDPTPDPTPEPTEVVMFVGDLDGGNSANKLISKFLSWKPYVSIKVVDENNAPVSGAKVDGFWEGISPKKTLCTTGSSGTCTIQGGSAKVSSVSYTVTSIQLSGYVYNSALNTDPDGDSNGTTINISVGN